jgi:hypothetical protein
MAVSYPDQRMEFTPRYIQTPTPEQFLRDFHEISASLDRHSLERLSLLDFKDEIEAKKARKNSEGWMLGGVLFPTKSAVEEYYAYLRRKWRPGEIITGPDHDFMLDLAMTHEWIEDKIGVGIKHFFVTHSINIIKGTSGGNEELGNRVVGFERHDGTWDDIGIKHLCKRRGHITVKTPEEQWGHYVRWRYSLLVQAFREAVGGQIGAFKEAAMRPDGLWQCEQSGELLRRGQVAVDHKPPMVFHALVADFMRRTGWGITQFDVMERFGSSTTLVHRYDMEEFRSYHQHFAELRILRNKENSENQAYGIKPAEIMWENAPDAAPWEGPQRIKLIPDFQQRGV